MPCQNYCTCMIDIMYVCMYSFAFFKLTSSLPFSSPRLIYIFLHVQWVQSLLIIQQISSFTALDSFVQTSNQETNKYTYIIDPVCSVLVSGSSVGDSETTYVHAPIPWALANEGENRLTFVLSRLVFVINLAKTRWKYPAVYV